MASINFEANNNSIEGKSKVVLRTNPLLSSNVKLVTDSSGDIYLDSISANKTLADQRFKKFNLDSSGHYAYDLAKFYKDTPLDIVYDTYRAYSDLSVYREYEKQYEEQYQYGAKLNGSRTYDENIRFMAPIWLEKTIPEYFVVYRVEEPVSTVSLSDNLNDINSRTMRMLSNATIVKTFDLRQGSKLGDYLNRFINDPARPNSPLTVSFERDEKISWNGIDLNKGGFVSKGTYLYDDFVGTDREEILNNELITKGFTRNSMVSANLINLEFLFEDNDNPYEVNRYFGVYVNENVEGSFKHSRYVNNSLVVDLDSVKTNYDLTGTTLDAIDMLPHEDLDKPVLQWFKSNNSFAHVKNTEGAQTIGTFNVNGLNIDTSNKFVKFKETLEIEAVLPNVVDFIKLTIDSKPNSGDEIVLASKSEFNISSDISLFEIIGSSSIPAGTSKDGLFSVNGSLEEITLAIRIALESILDSKFVITNDKTQILINNYTFGNRVKNGFFGLKNSNANFITVHTGLYDNITQDLKLPNAIYIKYDVYTLQGGSARNSGYLVNEAELGDITTESYLKVPNGYSRIVEMIQDPVNTDFYRVCLDRSGQGVAIEDKSINIYIENLIYFGKFDTIDFVDFDFNFYSTENSKLNELEFENNYSGFNNNQVESVNDMMMNPVDYFKYLESVRSTITPTSSGVSKIDNEYDRLEENNQTQFALFSRVIPSINKWVYKDSVNAKEKPYFLSVSEAFGKTNFSPDITIDGRDPEFLTHEWFYIYGTPNYTTGNISEMARSFYSYIQPDSTVDLTDANLKDVNEDYFDKLFIYEGVYNGGWIPAKKSKKYNRFIKGSDVNPAEVMFRGLKVKAFARKEFDLTSPKNLINTSEFNDYKFTSVLKYTNNTDDSINIKVIQNKQWETITIFIELNTSEDNIDFVNRKLLYELRDFYETNNPDPAGPSNTIINGYLNFDILQDQDFKTIKGGGIDTRLVRDIQVNSAGSYNDIHFEYLGDTWVLPVVNVDNDFTITIAAVDGAPGSIYNLLKNNTLTITSIPASIWATIDFEYVGGGYGLARGMLESISAKSIADTFNSNDTNKVKYITIEEDGTELLNRFILNIESGNNITKKSVLSYESDSDKPNSYKVSKGSIGYVTVDRTDTYNRTLNRMPGGYTPLFRDVTFFTDLYQAFKLDLGGSLTPDLERQKLIYNRFNRLGMAFASYVDLGYKNFGLIEDVFYHKVNPEKADSILKLSNTTGNQPLYPLIGETAIDKRNINIIRSSWEDGFYTKNDNNKNTNVFGTLSAHEESAYLASTLNLPKNQYEITGFKTIKTVTSFDDLKSIKETNKYVGDVVLFENESNIYVDLYLGNKMIDVLEDDNAGVSIKKYVIASQSYGDKTTLNDDIRQYIKVNILKLLAITDIRVFNKKTNQIQKSEILNAVNLNEILDTNFIEDKNFRLEYDNTNPLNIRVIYNKRTGFRHQLYIYVKINS
tara:strand:+ start:4269 stop:8675 length:4407 start_codon:yes stop_codon:yes gene_type:complete